MLAAPPHIWHQQRQKMTDQCRRIWVLDILQLVMACTVKHSFQGEVSANVVRLASMFRALMPISLGCGSISHPAAPLSLKQSPLHCFLPGRMAESRIAAGTDDFSINGLHCAAKVASSSESVTAPSPEYKPSRSPN